MTDAEKILEEFDSRKHNWRLDFDFWEKDMKDVLTTSIQEAVADERARIVGEIEKLKEDWKPTEGYGCEEEKGFQKGIISQIALKNAQIDELLASLNKPLAKKD